MTRRTPRPPPFEIIVVPGSEAFSLRWCLLAAIKIDGAKVPA